MQDINFEYLKIFYFTAKYQNMTKAAGCLYLTQPSVSHSIGQLESSLNCSLFYRVPKGVTLTKEGEILYKYVSKAYSDLLEAKYQLERIRNFESGEVRIGASDTALYFYLLDHMEPFRTKHTGIQIRILNTTTPLILKALAANEIDVAIVASPVEESPHYQQMTVAPIQDVFIAGNLYRHLQGQELELSDVCRYPLISISPESCSWHHYDHYFAQNHKSLHPEFTLSTSDLILPFVKRNLGIGILPSYFAKESIQQNEVFELNVKPPIPPRSIQVLMPRHAYPSPSVSLFLEELRSQ